MEERDGDGFKYCDNLGDLLQMTKADAIYPAASAKKWYVADSNLTVQEVLEVFPQPLRTLDFW